MKGQKQQKQTGQRETATPESAGEGQAITDTLMETDLFVRRFYLQQKQFLRMKQRKGRKRIVQTQR